MYKRIILFLFCFIALQAAAQSAEWRHLHQGNRAFMRGDYKTAEVEYRNAQKLNPRSARAAFNLGDVYMAQKNIQAALEQYQIAAAKGESNKYLRALSYHNVGVAYHLNKQFDKAIDFYKEALRNNPHDDDTRYNLVLCQKQKKEEQQEKQQNKHDNKQKKEEQNKQQNKPDKQKSQPEKSQQQEQKGGMSKDNADRLINLSQQAEQQTRNKLQRAGQPRQKQLNKNW